MRCTSHGPRILNGGGSRIRCKEGRSRCAFVAISVTSKDLNSYSVHRGEEREIPLGAVWHASVGLLRQNVRSNTTQSTNNFA